MLKRMILCGLLAAVAAPALASDVTYDVRVLSLQDAASTAATHKSQASQKKSAKDGKRDCTCDGQQPPHA